MKKGGTEYLRFQADNRMYNSNLLDEFRAIGECTQNI